MPGVVRLRAQIKSWKGQSSASVHGIGEAAMKAQLCAVSILQ